MLVEFARVVGYMYRHCFVWVCMFEFGGYGWVYGGGYLIECVHFMVWAG